MGLQCHVRMRETVADLHCSGDQLRQSYHRIWRMKKALYASNHHIGGEGVTVSTCYKTLPK